MLVYDFAHPPDVVVAAAVVTVAVAVAVVAVVVHLFFSWCPFPFVEVGLLF